MFLGMSRSWAGAGVYQIQSFAGPEGAVAYLDFVDGIYAVNGGVQPIGALLGGNFDPVAIYSHGYRIGSLWKDTSGIDDPEASGDLLTAITNAITNDGGFIVVMEFEEQVVSGNYVPMLTIGDHASDHDLATDVLRAEYGSGGGTALDIYNYSGTNTIAVSGSGGSLPVPGRRRVAAALAFDNGDATFRYAISANGSTPATDDRAFDLTPFAPGKVSFMASLDLFEAPSDAFLRKIELWPIADPALLGDYSTLPAFSLPAAADPAFAAVRLLVDFDGAADATTETDASLSGHVLTFQGTAKLDDAISPPWGGATALLCDGGGYVTLPGSTDFDFEGGPFQIEMLIRWDGTGTGIKRLIERNGSFLLYHSGTALSFQYTYGTGTVRTFSSIAALTANTWHHVVIARMADGRIYRYFDGAARLLYSWHQQDILVTNTNDLGIGANASGTGTFLGLIGSTRVIKGSGVQDSPIGFQPRTTAFPTS